MVIRTPQSSLVCKAENGWKDSGTTSNMVDFVKIQMEPYTQQTVQQSYTQSYHRQITCIKFYPN